MSRVTQNRFPIKKFSDRFKCVVFVETRYVNTDVFKLESS